ncbi:MAG: hypothetical protein LLF96_09885 [Eubacteriales bacterium]|nr:hypothetical protein [Eubacteriales bacterium]
MYPVENLPPMLPIGRQGEHGIAQIQFDVSAWASAYPGIVCALTLQVPDGGAPFPVTGVARSDNVLTWCVQREATAAAGLGSLIVRGYQDVLEVRSARTRTLVEAGQGPAGEAPAAVADWVGEAAALKARVEAQSLAVAQAEDARNVYEPWNAAARYLHGNKVALNGRSYVWTLAAPSPAGLPPPSDGWLMISDRGDLYLAVFHIDALGQLNVEYSEEYEGPVFHVNENGELEVVS